MANQEDYRVDPTKPPLHDVLILPVINDSQLKPKKIEESSDETLKKNEEIEEWDSKKLREEIKLDEKIITSFESFYKLIQHELDAHQVDAKWLRNTLLHKIKYKTTLQDITEYVDFLKSPLSRCNPDEDFSQFYKNKRNLEVKDKDQPLVRSMLTTSKIKRNPMWKQRGTTPIRFLVNEYLSSLPSEEEENLQIPQPALHPESPHPSSFQKPVTDVEMKDGMKTEQSNEEPPKKKVKMEANQLPFQPKPQIQIPGISLFAKDQSTPKATEDAEGQKSEAPKRIPALHKRRVQGPGIYLIPEFCDIALISFNSPFQLRILAKVVTQMRQVHEYHEKLKEFEKFIGIKFKDMKLLRQAFTHPSYATEHYNRDLHYDYQRLEFLGDAIIEIVTTEFLFENCKSASEGVLTELRSVLVNNQHLERIAKRLKLMDYVLIAENQKKTVMQQSHKLSADVLEALIGMYIYTSNCKGATFMDQDFEAAKDFVYKHILKTAEYCVKQHPDFSRLTFHSFDEPVIANIKLSPELMQLITRLEEKIGVKFNNKFILLEALVCPSCTGFLNTPRYTMCYAFNYQRLEFLGDAVLKFVVSHHLYLNYPTATESKMTLKKHETVDNLKSLPLAAKSIDLMKFIQFRGSKDMFREDTNNWKNIVSDVFEAIIGAIYVDQGKLHLYGPSDREYDVFGGFIHKYVIKLRQQITPENVQLPMKNRLQNIIQKLINGVLPEYRKLNDEYKLGNTPLVHGVYVGSVLVAVGEGATKHESEHKAAEKALSLFVKMEKEYPRLGKKTKPFTKKEDLEAVILEKVRERPELTTTNAMQKKEDAKRKQKRKQEM